MNEHTDSNTNRFAIKFSHHGHIILVPFTAKFNLITGYDNIMRYHVTIELHLRECYIFISGDAFNTEHLRRLTTY